MLASEKTVLSSTYLSWQGGTWVPDLVGWKVLGALASAECGVEEGNPAGDLWEKIVINQPGLLLCRE